MPTNNSDLAHELSRQREQEREAAAQRIARGDPAWHHETGIMAVVEAARDVAFPIASDDLAEVAGDRYVTASDRLTLPLAEVLAHLPEREFESLRSLERAVQKHWQGIKFLEVPEEQRSPTGGFQPQSGASWPGHSSRRAQGLRHAKGRGG